MPHPTPSHDVFIAHSDDAADAQWVRGDLRRRLAAANLSAYVPTDDLPLGALTIPALAAAMQRSRKVLLILTPAFFVSPWGGFLAALVQHLAPTNAQQWFLPILLQPCAVPSELAIFTALDMVTPDTDTDPWARLFANLDAPPPRAAAFLDGRVPAPYALPPGSRMPFAANPQFVGRVADLQQLAAGLDASTTAAISPIVAASGLGGIGKTQLATEFVHRYGQFYPGGVQWLSFADPASVPAELASCALVLRPGLSTQPLAEQILGGVRGLGEQRAPTTSI